MRVRRRQKSKKVRRSHGRSNSGSFNDTIPKFNTSFLKCSDGRKGKNLSRRVRRKIGRKTKKRAVVTLSKLCTAVEEQHSTTGISKTAARADTRQLILKLLGDKSSAAICCYDDDEANQLQDMDLMILGSTSEEYKRYTQLLRQEYISLNDVEYKQMRLKVLQTLLLIPNIFACPEFQARYEQQARTNIKQEIEELKHLFSPQLTNSDDLPTTSAQAAAVTRAVTTTDNHIADKPRTKFKKFLNDSTQKSNGRNFRRIKHLNSSNTSTASQIATRKLLRSIRRRQNQKLVNHISPRKTGRDLCRQLNFSKEKVLARTELNAHRIETTLEEGEIVSENDASKENAENADDAKKSESKNGDDDDDVDDDDDDDTDDDDGTDDSDDSDNDEDCVYIEPHIELITIDDEAEPATSKALDPTLSKKSHIITSTPHEKIKIDAANFFRAPGSPSCSAISATASGESKSGIINIDDDTPLVYFKDTSTSVKWLETISSQDTFSDYTKLTTLRGGKKRKRRRSQRLKAIRTGHPITIDVTRTNDDIICLDESTLKPMQPEFKSAATPRKRRNNRDDSVIFVSESNPNTLPAYIPLESDDVPNPIRVDITPRKPQSRRPRNDLFTKSEKKQLTEYNDNAYNPSAGDQSQAAGKRMVIIDGSNVAFNHALNKEFSVKGLKICLDYFEKMGHDAKAIVPQFRLNKYKSSDPEELAILHKAGKIVYTPCKNLPGAKSISYDDRFVLQLACELDAAIVSNDNYRDLINENSAFKKIIENRVIGYSWCNDIFILPKDPYGKWGPDLHTILNRK